MSIDPESKREIIIVRRGRHDDHDGHHGGVWKIAYADFMTAMMAFFSRHVAHQCRKRGEQGCCCQLLQPCQADGPSFESQGRAGY